MDERPEPDAPQSTPPVRRLRPPGPNPGATAASGTGAPEPAAKPRPATAPEHAARPRPAAAPEPAAPEDTGPWRADWRLTIFKLLGLVVFAVAALVVAGDPVGTGLLVLAAVLCGGWALRDLVVPVRLAADTDGVTVIRGYLGHARLSWSDIERIRVDRRSRLGMRSEFLEIDTGHRLYLLSSYDLSAEPAAVAAALARIRTG